MSRWEWASDNPTRCKLCGKWTTCANLYKHNNTDCGVTERKFTLKEVREFTGLTMGELNHYIRTGRCEVERTEGKRRVWVTEAGLKKFCELLSKDPQAVLRMAKTL